LPSTLKAQSLDGFRGSGADFMPEFKPYIEDGQTWHGTSLLL